MNQLQSLHTFGLQALSQETHIIHSFDVLPLHDKSKPRWLLGEGSNCIFVDDFNGAVWVNKTRGVEVSQYKDTHCLRVASGENWHQLVVQCLSQGIYGFENLALIPGTVGAAPIQNIGAYGREVGQFISAVEVLDLSNDESFTLNNQECQFGYRDSVFKRAEAKEWFITHVNFEVPTQLALETSYGELKQLQNPTAQTIFDTVVDIRQSKLPDPVKQGNAGSFFKNPVISKTHLATIVGEHGSAPHFVVDDAQVKIPAAWLIDKAGFKGQSRGGVQSHQRQPLVLLNQGGATGQDVLSFAREIQTTINETFGILLENEVRLVGKHGLITL